MAIKAMIAGKGIALLAYRAPLSAQALAVCLLCAVIGVSVLDDYGVGADVHWQRNIAYTNVRYIYGDRDALYVDHNRYYGVAFELPLLLAEHWLGLDDSRNWILSRHLLTHLFFLTGGFFAALLVYRLFGSRWLALFALLAFLLHPRLYAHSFFNSKDIPALSMFMIALYLTHRAFRRETVGAFVLCGVGVALAMNMRIMGAMLLPAVLSLRCLDWYFAGREGADGGGRGRGRVLLTAGVFVLAGVGTLYATMPFLWDDPLAWSDALAALSHHPHYEYYLFRGAVAHAWDPPVEYLPTWIGISTPPGVLLLALLGAAAVGVRSIIRPCDALRDVRLRFGLLLTGCLALSVLAVIVLGSHMYNGWRHMYLLYAPIALLSSYGLYYLATALGGLVRRWSAWGYCGVIALAALGLAGVVAAMWHLHPHQQVYFNFLVDRKTPEHLSSQYDLDYWRISERQGLEDLLAMYPKDAVYALSSLPHGVESLHHPRSVGILPEQERSRIVLDNAARSNFYINSGSMHASIVKLHTANILPTVARGQAYGSTLYTVDASDYSVMDDAGIAALQKTWDAAVAGEPSVRAVWDLYWDENTLTYVRAPCRRGDKAAGFFLHIAPVEVSDLPPGSRRRGFENRDFYFDWYGVRLDGKCLAKVPLPGYPIAGIRTGQYNPVDAYEFGEGQIWRAYLPGDH